MQPVEESELFYILTRAWHLKRANFNGLPAGLLSYDGNLYDHHPWELQRRLSSSASAATTIYMLAFKQLGRRKTKDGMRWRQSGGMLESECGLLRSYFTYRPCDKRIQGPADRWNMIEFSLAQHREVKKSRVPVVSIIKQTLICDSVLEGSRLVVSGISEETRQAPLSSPSTAVFAAAADHELNAPALAEHSEMAPASPIWAELEQEIDFSESLWCGGRCRFEGPIVQESDWNDEHFMGFYGGLLACCVKST